uniref:Uncharacterized protein n=1 Tax=Arundo donax TaxID=35708 RepID=A0A0A9GIS6_ARUDO
MPARDGRSRRRADGFTSGDSLLLSGLVRV